MKYVHVLLLLTGFASRLHCMDDQSRARESIAKLALPLLVLGELARSRATTYAERRQYGFNGLITPIYQQVSPASLVLVGCVIEDAQPASLFGYWYADSAVPANYLFLKGLRASIKGRWNGMRIESSMLVGENRIAIMWRDMPGSSQQKLNISVSEVTDGVEIDLDGGKFEMPSLPSQ